MHYQAYRDLVVNTTSTLDESKRALFLNQLSASEKNPVIMFGFNAFLGTFGIDRFLVGDIISGILKLLTLGGFGIWVLVDCFLIAGRTRSKNANMLLQLAASLK
ncbi:MAG: hypothetical protein CME93_02360 [Hyphomonadaceae bacterium]|nr:hypothetical protein [Hyphomonadaceae bacterium]OUX94267.1 MAG: hypothetical protein CBB77_03950 [Hyphomonas sp. TMED17]CAI8404216.1 MAG: Uncharacterised protein [Hyphomonas sp. TMED17]